jgi:hypothetical protein
LLERHSEELPLNLSLCREPGTSSTVDA